MSANNRKEHTMHRCSTIALGATALLFTVSSAALAQNSPPTYQADPSVYKVIYENDNFRAIAATWEAGQTDKPHSHPVPSVLYSLTDCTLKVTNADGTTRDVKNKAGAAMDVPITASHSAHNVGDTTCRVVFVEQKK
jgi:quercetin dioxygenase-like cupin family protein